MESNADLLLVHRLLAGDDRAFEELFEGHFAALCRFALVRLGGDGTLAEEIAQVTLCRAIDRLASYRGEASLHTWLCTVCRRVIINYLVARGRRPSELELAEDDPHVRAALGTLAREAGGPEEALHRQEVARRVHATLGALPPHYGEALSWKYLGELSVVEIGERLELTPKATESLLTRARQAFREAFLSLFCDPTRGEAR